MVGFMQDPLNEMGATSTKGYAIDVKTVGSSKVLHQNTTTSDHSITDKDICLEDVDISDFEFPTAPVPDAQKAAQRIPCLEVTLPPTIQVDEFMQPLVEPSPCLRKSIVPEQIEQDMHPLGLAKIFDLKAPKAYIGWEDLVPVYGGNPFAQALRNRTPSKDSCNRNDLSDLKDIPTINAKKCKGFVQVDRGVEKLLILRNKEDPSKPLDAPGQPEYIEVPLAKVRKSGCIFAKLLDEKDNGNGSRFQGNTIVYSFDSALKPNIYVQDYAVYIDTLMTSDFARASQGYYRVQDLTSRQIWTGIKIWGAWAASSSFRPSYTEEEAKNALLVGIFIGDPLYSEDLYKMIVARGYHHACPIVGALASMIRMM